MNLLQSQEMLAVAWSSDPFLRVGMPILIKEIHEIGGPALPSSENAEPPSASS